MSAHALLGASSAHRWITCPPSARLEEAQGASDNESPYAAEGTAAHEYAEIELSHRLGKINNRSYSGRMKKVKAGPWWGTEMEEAVGDYANRICEYAEGYRRAGAEPFVDLEQRMDFTKWVPEGFGTADVVILAGNVLHVIDLKYGKGVPVSAEENPQLRLYALGAIEKYRILFDFDIVSMTIIQPRLGAASTDTMTLAELEAWAETVVRPAAELAYLGHGEPCPSESACRWCRAKATCRARADAMIATAISEFDDDIGFSQARFDAANPPSAEDVEAHAKLGGIVGFGLDPSCAPTFGGEKELMLTIDEIAALLPALPAIEAWAKDVQDWALEQARDHNVRFPGYKLVEGRSIRRITDAEAAAQALENAGYEPDQFYKPAELMAIGGLEKLLGKKGFADLLGGFVDKPAGKPALVPTSDKRPELGSAQGAISDFEETV